MTARPLVRGHTVVLRAWRMSDVSMMVELFDTAEMDRWTPLARPFDESVATAYVRRAQELVRGGTLQLAITTDGEIPLGEVLLFPGQAAEECELAYAVGAAHRGHALAARAIRALLPTARERKGYVLDMGTWARDLGPGPAS